jgi:uncharacterized membrane protein (DUF485 family)
MTSSIGSERPGANDVAVRKRNALLRGGLVFGVFILYPLLATLTPVLDGSVGGVSVAYLVGFLEIAFGVLVALTHATRATRAEEG